MDNTAMPGAGKLTNWFQKFVECLFAGIGITNTLAIVLEFLPQKVQMKLGDTFYSYILVGELALPLVFAIGYAVYWQLKEKKQAIDSGVRHAWLRGIMRGWLAMEIATYGFAKILKTQFGQSFHRDDTLVGTLNGFNLTWNYFAHSYVMVVIIALVQIGGSILLLFRRTTLLATAILLPVMINIVLINIFYDIASGAFLNSVLFTLALFYLLTLRWGDLQAVFLQGVSNLPVVGAGWLRYLLKFLAIAAAFGIIYYYTTENTKTSLVGKWKVEQIIRNRDTVNPNAWLKDTTAWTTVYVEQHNTMFFCPNPYLYDKGRSTNAEYKYDSLKHTINLAFWKKDKKVDSAVVTVSSYKGKKMEWKTFLNKDTVKLLLSRVR